MNARPRTDGWAGAVARRFPQRANRRNRLQGKLMGARGRGGQEGGGWRWEGGHTGGVVESDGQKTMSTLAHRWQ